MASDLYSTDYASYDAATAEMTLLEQVSIQGRKTDLRQLFKLLNLARNGQPKAVLISGSQGVGKSALLETFVDIVRKGVPCRIVNLQGVRYDTPEQLYVAMVDHFLADAESIVDEALVAVNEVLGELGIQWERQDLLRAVALVKLQESIGGKEATSQEQLMKAIRSSVPTIKKLKFSVNESIEKLVGIIVNPWLTVATSFLSPLTPSLQESLEVARQLREGGIVERQGLALASAASVPQPLLLPETNGNGHYQNGATPDVEGPTIDVTVQEPIGEQNADQVMNYAVVSKPVEVTPTRSASYGRAAASSGPANKLLECLLEVFRFVNRTVQGMDSALLLTIDDWDRIVTLPENQREPLKEFLSGLLQGTTDCKNYHLMVCLCCQSGTESYSLGGPLYSLFRSKLLLPGLNDKARRKLFKGPFKDARIDIDEDVMQDISGMTMGSPFWVLKFRHFLLERAEANGVRRVDREFYRQLGVERLEDLLELSFTRVKLSFVENEAVLYKVIASLIRQFELQPFDASVALREISASQDIPFNQVFEVLRSLYQHNFLSEVERLRVAGQDPHYRIESREVLHFLQQETGNVQPDVSANEKIDYLKRIIPLSVRSGELDREKTREVLSLSQALGNDEMIHFLEETFSTYLEDPSPTVRVTALNNMAVLETERAFEAIIGMLRDEQAMVREYAARNLALFAKKPGHLHFSDRIVDAMIEYIDDESDAVRTQVYETLSKYKWSHDLISVFLKGLADALESVRTIAIQNLVEMGAESPMIRNSLMDATDDSCVEVRKYACLGIQRYPGPETIDVLTRMLRKDSNTGLRALAADVLSHMDERMAMEALVSALQEDPSEDVKLAVIRALGKRKGWQTEEVLLNFIHEGAVGSPSLLWACVRSLGQVGGTELSLNTLKEIKSQSNKGGLGSDILMVAANVAIQKIHDRLEDLRMMEQQLKAATPTTYARAAEDDDIIIVEDERVEVD